MYTNATSNPLTTPTFITPYRESCTGLASQIFEGFITPKIELFGRLPLTAARVTVYTGLLLASFLEQAVTRRSLTALRSLFVHLIAGSLYLPSSAAPTVSQAKELFAFVGDLEKAELNERIGEVILGRISQNQDLPIDFLKEIVFFLGKEEGIRSKNETELLFAFFEQLSEMEEKPKFTPNESIFLLKLFTELGKGNARKFDRLLSPERVFIYLMEQTTRSPEIVHPKALLSLTSQFQALGRVHDLFSYVGPKVPQNLTAWALYHTSTLSKEELFQLLFLLHKDTPLTEALNKAFLDRLESLDRESPISSADFMIFNRALGPKSIERTQLGGFVGRILRREKPNLGNFTAEQYVHWTDFYWLATKYYMQIEDLEQENQVVQRLKNQFTLRQMSDCYVTASETFEKLITPAVKLLEGKPLQSCKDMFDFLVETSMIKMAKDGKNIPTERLEELFEPIKKQLLRPGRTFTTPEEIKSLRGLLALFYSHNQWDEEAFGKVKELKIEAAKWGIDWQNGFPKVHDRFSKELALRSLEFLRDLPYVKTFRTVKPKDYHYYSPYLLELEISFELGKPHDDVKGILLTLGLKSSDIATLTKCKAILAEWEEDNSNI